MDELIAAQVLRGLKGEQCRMRFTFKYHGSKTAPGGNSNKYIQEARSKISQRHILFTHNHTYNLDYVLNNLQLSAIEEGLKSFKREREAGEKPPREEKLGRELGLGFTSQIIKPIFKFL